MNFSEDINIRKVTQIYRLTDISYDENGSITGIQRDFIPRLDQVV